MAVNWTVVEVSTVDLNALLKSYIELILECQRRGVIYG